MVQFSFNSNYAEDGGGAMYIIYANFIFCGNINSGSSNISFDTGALHVPLYKANAFDPECSTDTALSFNNSITFLDNAARYYGGASIDCGDTTVTFIGTTYFNESHGSAIEGYSCNMTFIGTTFFFQKQCN